MNRGIFGMIVIIDCPGDGAEVRELCVCIGDAVGSEGHILDSVVTLGDIVGARILGLLRVFAPLELLQVLVVELLGARRLGEDSICPLFSGWLH